jgi:hypothetical protein
VAAGKALGVKMGAAPAWGGETEMPMPRGNSIDLLAANAAQKATAANGWQSAAYESGQQWQAEPPKVEVTVEPQEVKIFLDRREIAKVVVEEMAHEEKRKGRG